MSEEGKQAALAIHEQYKARIADLEYTLRMLVEDITHEDHLPNDWSVQVAVRQAREVLANAGPR